MKKIAKRLSALVLSTVFATMQVSAYDVINGDIGIGSQHGGSSINSSQGGYLGTNIDKTNNSATLEFNNHAHVDWDRLNVNSGEKLNFNAIDGANGLTVVNTVRNGMTNVYGEINANDGIAKLIISNPNGMIYDGATFTTTGDVELTTQALAVNYLKGNINIDKLNQAATEGVIIKNGSKFNIGGEFNIIAPSVDVIGSYVGAGKGLNLITRDGESYLVCPTLSGDYTHSAVSLQAVEINGNVYIITGEDIIMTADGGKITGNLTIDSKGNVGLNYDDGGKTLHITGNLDAKADGKANIIRNAIVDGNVVMSNSDGYVEIVNGDIGGNVDLITTRTEHSDPDIKHFVHVVGNTDIDGYLNINSANNIHIGGYNEDLKTLIPGRLTVGDYINALAQDGSIAITIDTLADKAFLISENKNIISDGKACLTANEYKFDAMYYIGGLKDVDYMINTVMEDYQPVGAQIVGGSDYFNIAGGNVTKFKQGNTNFAFLKSNGDMNINNVDAGNVMITSNQHDIVIGNEAKANQIQVGGETKNLTVKLPQRDYLLHYTNIKDTEVITIQNGDEITYEMANGANGWNKGIQTADNTYLVVPGPSNPPVEPPVDPVIPPSDPEDPTKDDAEKILKNLNRDEVASAIDAQQVMTPVAFAADLDDEIETGVRKNVDGSVTVVRPYTPSK